MRKAAVEGSLFQRRVAKIAKGRKVGYVGYVGYVGVWFIF